MVLWSSWKTALYSPNKSFYGNILLNCVKFLNLVKERIRYANKHFKMYFVGTQYCLTVHLFTDHGKSTSVTKKCATGEECHFVGCHHHRESGHTVSTTLCTRAADWFWGLHFSTCFSCWAEEDVPSYTLQYLTIEIEFLQQKPDYPLLPTFLFVLLCGGM